MHPGMALGMGVGGLLGGILAGGVTAGAVIFGFIGAGWTGKGAMAWTIGAGLTAAASLEPTTVVPYSYPQHWANSAA